MQRSHPGRKLRWILGSSLLLGAAVVMVWSVTFSESLQLSQPVYVANEKEASEINGGPRVLSLWEVTTRRFQYMADVVGSFFSGPAPIPVPGS